MAAPAGRGSPGRWRRAVGGWFGSLRARAAGELGARSDDLLIVDTELLRKLDRISLSVGADLVGGLMGEHPAHRRTTGIEFADFRPYSAGDDLRRLDWNAYARLGTLHVRQAQAEHDTSLHILLDASPSMAFGAPSKFLAGRRLAASFGYIALAHLDSVVMTTPGGQSLSAARPGGAVQRFRGRAESGEMFRLLQGLSTQSVAEFDGYLSAWAGEYAGRAGGRVALVISDLLLDGWRDGVKSLITAGFSTHVLQLLTPEEVSPHTMGDLELVDSETGERMEIYLGNEGLAEYRRRVRAWLDETEGWCRAQGAGYLLVMSDQEIERVMLETLRRQGVTA